MQDLREYIQEINNRNANQLQLDYDLNNETKDYIFHNFWPIITIYDRAESELNKFLNKSKNDFILKHGKFDISIYKREYGLTQFLYELKNYVRAFQIGKLQIGIVAEFKGDYFYDFDDEMYGKNSLIISSLEPIKLEIYLKNIIDFIKQFIESEENKNVKKKVENTSTIQQKETIKPELKENLLLQQIENAFKFMQFDDDRKHEVILNEKDYENLIEWLLFYFENNFKLPEIKNPIKIINTNKGNVIYTFKLIFDELHPSKTRPDSLFELINLCFYQYRNSSVENSKKQSKPQFYDDIINNYQ